MHSYKCLVSSLCLVLVLLVNVSLQRAQVAQDISYSVESNGKWHRTRDRLNSDDFLGRFLTKPQETAGWVFSKRSIPDDLNPNLMEAEEDSDSDDAYVSTNDTKVGVVEKGEEGSEPITTEVYKSVSFLLKHLKLDPSSFFSDESD